MWTVPRRLVDLNDLQPKAGVETAEILGVACEDTLAVNASANDDARVNDIAAAASPKEHAYSEGCTHVQGNDLRLLRFHQSRKPCLARTIPECLCENPGWNVEDRIGPCQHTVEQRQHALIPALHGNQCAGIKRQPSQSGSDIARTLSAHAYASAPGSPSSAIKSLTKSASVSSSSRSDATIGAAAANAADT